MKAFLSALPPHTLEILNGIAFGVALLGAVGASQHHGLPLLLVLLLAGCLGIFYFLVATSKPALREHHFKRDSLEFDTFFSRWYRQSGDHVIFCDDLDWVDDAQGSLLAALEANASSVTLFIRSHSATSVRVLEEAGATITPIPDRVSCPFKFSLHATDGIDRLIIRIDPTIAENVISFRETDDGYVIALARDVLSACVQH